MTTTAAVQKMVTFRLFIQAGNSSIFFRNYGPIWQSNSRGFKLSTICRNNQTKIAPIDFYYVPGSAPCRNVMLTAKAVGVELNLKFTNMLTGEHMTPEYLKLNPQHSLPTINDNGFILWESRSIMTYLVNQYGKNDTLYPKDPKKRAVVDQRLYFDMGTLFRKYEEYFFPQIFAKGPAIPAKLEKLQEALVLLDGFIGNHDYATGNTLTLADLALVSSVSTFEVSGIDISGHKNVVRWYNKVKATAPGYVEANEKPLQKFKALIENRLKST